jgi:hypothetical protein
MMVRTSVFASLLVTAAAAVGLAGCSGDDGRPTTATGTGAGTTPTATSAGATTPPAEAGAKKGLTEACLKDDDCTSGTCYPSDQGPLYCSAKCTADNATTVCVAPLAGTCNKKGFCKKP